VKPPVQQPEIILVKDNTPDTLIIKGSNKQQVQNVVINEASKPSTNIITAKTLPSPPPPRPIIIDQRPPRPSILVVEKDSPQTIIIKESTKQVQNVVVNEQDKTRTPVANSVNIITSKTLPSPPPPQPIIIIEPSLPVPVILLVKERPKQPIVIEQSTSQVQNVIVNEAPRRPVVQQRQSLSLTPPAPQDIIIIEPSLPVPALLLVKERPNRPIIIKPRPVEQQVQNVIITNENEPQRNVIVSTPQRPLVNSRPQFVSQAQQEVILTSQ